MEYLIIGILSTIAVASFSGEIWNLLASNETKEKYGVWYDKTNDDNI